MTLPTWPTGPLPVLGDEQNVSYRTKSARFGDGYEERTLSGINSKIKKGNLLFRAITTEQKNTYVNFLDARSGIQPFYITLPSDNVPTIVLVTEYKSTTIGGYYHELSFSYTQFFPYNISPVVPEEPEDEFVAIPVGDDPQVVTPSSGGAGVSLAAPGVSTFSFAPIASLIGSGVDMELRLSSAIVAVVSFPSDYLNPLRYFEYYHEPTDTTYTNIFSNSPIDLDAE